MNTNNQSSLRRMLAPALALACGAIFLAFITAPVATTQSRIIAPQRSANSNTSTKRPRVATLRANDSPEGSRVALTADQSLSNYEAYRRGDRFYVRIPAVDVPRPEAVRGRAFGDVKVQRSASDTVVSFRLQPGATARVEQRGNKLDVVFTMPGARNSASTSPRRDVSRPDAGPAPPPPQSSRRGNTNSNPSSASSLDRSENRMAAASSRPSPAPRGGASPKPSPTPSVRPSPAQTSPSPKGSPVVAQQRSSSSPAATVSSQSQGTTWNRLKQRARYWILLAQLNPVPVGIGVAVLLLFIGLLVMQRRRAKATRRARPRKAAKPAVAAEVKAAASAMPTEMANAAEASTALGETTTDVATLANEPTVPTPAAPADAQHERVTRASEEVKRLMAGGDYDESVIASDDSYTRQLVGAELLSALVGRNLQRRERARAAFMQHGYFDDATRDLRIGASPNERAAAARRLSFVHDREATPHLIAALEDSSPDVRRASVEALMDLRDPAAIASLNSLMQTETDRRVPRSLIKHAIESCATTESPEVAATSGESPLPYSAAASVSQSAETEREVIEI